VQPVHVVKLDQAQQLMLIRYYSCAADPSEVVRYSGEAVEPAYTKTTSLVYFGRPWLYQRELWVSAVRDVSVEIDGASCRLTVGPQFAPGYESNVVNVWKRLARSEPPTNDHESTGARSTSAAALPTTSPSLQPAAAPSPAAAAPSPAPAAAPDARPGTAESSARRLSPARPKGTGKLTPTRRATRRVKALLRRIGIEVSRTRPDTNVPRAPEPVEEGPAAVVKRARSANSRARYANAWVLIDRDTMAHDNAEALYRYLVENEPEINAWFVLSRSSTDWERLQRDGFRLVEHGSAEHVVLMKNADYLLSSQIDEYVVKPYDAKVYGKGHWKYVFLQHGVTHNDLSRWINPKPIELMITATEKETDAIVADRSPYVWSRKEVKLTGFPRHDSLLRKSRELDDATPRTLVMMPTWRDDLQVRSLGGHYRELRPDFAETQYAREWGGLLGSDALREIAGRHRLRIQFAPHPNLQLQSGAFDLPADVELIRYRDVDIQHVLACARLLVTDYSSLAFEAAYLKTPVVYFQFDRADFFSGRHAVRRGTFSYEHDGFGPVVTNQDSALDAIATMLDTDSDRRRFYDDRLESAFPPRDGLASARLVQVIRDAEQPFSRQTCRSRARSDRRPGGLDHDQPVRGLPGVRQSHHEVRRLDHEGIFDGGNPLTKLLHPFEVV
jgi:CDP-glycerol glycerophosphotransferase (TagB/SpsB family)